MEIKDFKKNQKAFVLRGAHAQFAQPEWSEDTVSSVSQNCVTLECGQKFEEIHGYSKECLVENKNFGDPALLFTDKESLDRYLEKCALTTQIMKQIPHLYECSLEQLKSIKDAVTADKETILLDFNNDYNHSIRCVSVSKADTPKISSLYEKAAKAAKKDGYAGWVSKIPNEYLKEVGLDDRAVVTVSFNDDKIRTPEYEKNGYFRVCCGNCDLCEIGWCRKYLDFVNPDDTNSCFRNPELTIYQIEYGEEKVLDFAVKKNKGIDGYFPYLALKILTMFAAEDKKLQAVLNDKDFAPEKLWIHSKYI